MKPFALQLDKSSDIPLYIQLYQYLKNEITCGNLKSGEKLPSLRNLSKDLSISITTAEWAYNQLLVEGYIISKPQSGYYIAQVIYENAKDNEDEPLNCNLSAYTFQDSEYKYDLSCFDFLKWKKCTSRVLTEYSHLLLFESDTQGEAALRFEISKYIYSSRGVRCTPDQIVVGAGTQQLTTHICRILKKINITHVSTEDPGYLPVQNIFRDHGFGVARIPVAQNGICIEKLPSNIPSAVYVNPSNQFPTGSVMPIGRRYELLKWAKGNNSYILEDDYDSELRYFGKPVPALQGLEKNSNVIYLGSFSSTLFPAIKISYMVLPEKLVDIFNEIKSDYTQTCSKMEQLTLALFMEDGLYYTNIKKLRNLYAQKLQATLTAITTYGNNFIEPLNTNSGINLILKVKTKKEPSELCKLAKSIRLNVIPVESMNHLNEVFVNFYYNQLPLSDIDVSIKEMLALWQK